MTLFLSHDDVCSAITMKEAIAAMERAFVEEAGGGVTLPPRTNIPAGGGWLRIGPVVMEASGWMGFKAMNLSPGVGVRYQVHLYRVADGSLQAIMDAQHLTTLRTGASSAVATRLLATPGQKTVAVLGSGVEAWAQLEAMQALGVVETARVFSPTAENRDRFARDFSDKHGVTVSPVASAKAAVDGAGIVVAAVKSKQYVLSGEWLQPGVHVNSVGTAKPDLREIDPETFRRSDIVAVDTRHGVFNEAGDAIAAAEVCRPEDAFELCDIVTGKGPRRANDEQITLFKSVGTGIQDIALAADIYERAKMLGLGTALPEFPRVKAR